MPLVDLHRHLDGNVNVSTICELGREFKVDLPSYDCVELSQHCQIHDKTADLLAFLQKLDFGVSVLGNAQACKRIAYENVEDAFVQGIDYAELRFSPLYMSKAFGLDLDDVVEAVIEGVILGTQKFPIKVQLIGILSRTYGVKECMDELSALLNAKQHICALDLAGDELGSPAILFEQHFKLAAQVGWGITVHAGEADGANSIWDAINRLGATRIGHGVAALEDPSLMDYLRDNKIGIESCLTSNYQTATVIDLSKHPLKKFMEHGLSVTLNTDDPGVSNITIQDEYKLARDVVGLTRDEIRMVQMNGIQQAFLSDAERDNLLGLRQL